MNTCICYIHVYINLLPSCAVHGNNYGRGAFKAVGEGFLGSSGPI